jgi:hypothetical protein
MPNALPAEASFIQKVNFLENRTHFIDWHMAYITYRIREESYYAIFYVHFIGGKSIELGKEPVFQIPSE